MMVQLERKYELSRDLGTVLIVDIYADFVRNSFDNTLTYYGFSSQNWIEIKYFSGWRPEKKSSPSTTSNTAAILKDILRLIILTGAKQFNHRRYLLLVFDNDPRKYLARSIKGHGKRDWLELLLDNKLAQKSLQIQLDHEKNHFIERIGGSGIIKDIALSLSCQSFAPISQPNLNDYNDLKKYGLLMYSYLIRIDGFKINWSGGMIPGPNDQATYNGCRGLADVLWA